MAATLQQNLAVANGARNDLLALPLAAFRYPDVAVVDLYGLVAEHGDLQLICGRQRTLGQNELAELARRGHQWLVVQRSDVPVVVQALLNSLEDIADDLDVSPTDRAAMVQFAGLMELDRALQLVSSDRYVELSRRFGKCLAAIFPQDGVSPADFFRALLHDERPCVHAVNVACYAVCLAQRLGTPREDLERIAVGALLHDLGKHLRSGQSLASDRFSATRHATSCDYPQAGYEELCLRSDLDHDQLMMIYQQQERCDGSGFPVGLIAAEIHPWAKLLAVVDQFDEQTCLTNDNLLGDPTDALALLAAGAGSRFDPEAVRCWIAPFQST
ncbi:MAG: HD domain-containing phosphohydrolase [Planctomycetota bacterium]